jgi:tRNA threonylcarbamoyl adenosine modification protein YeaZ
LPSDHLVLGFDTAAAHCAAVLLSGDAIAAAACEDMPLGQAERLIPMLEEVLAEAGAAWGDLAALGVGTGPGNFTGIRIAVAAARGLRLALRIPAVGVSGLEALAHGTRGPVLAVIDARQGRVYAQAYRDGVALAAPVLADIGDVPGLLPHDGAVAGLPAVPGAGAVPVPANPADAVARIAALRWQDAPGAPAPVYLRGADAALPADPPPVILG